MKSKITTKILIGLVLGIIAGLLVGKTHLTFINTWIKPFGTLFIRMIQMSIVPLVLSTLVVGASSMGDVRKLGRIGVKTILFFLITSAIAIFVGLFLANVMKPGVGLALFDVEAAAAASPPHILQIITDMIPTNSIGALAAGNMLQIIAFAVFLGVGITRVGEKAKPFHNFFESWSEVMFQIVSIVIGYAPIGVFALMMPVAAEHGPNVLGPLAKVIVAVYIGCILHMAIVYSGLLSIFARMSPVKFFRGILPAAVVAFTTCSSNATLPITLKNTQDMGVPKDISSFVVSLGATVHMDGTALYQGVCALFIAQAYNIPLTFTQQLMIVLTAVLASIGTAGVPGAGAVMLTLVLTQLKLPLEGVGLIWGIDRILDMARTTVNIVGDSAVAITIAATEGELKHNPEKIET